MTKMIREEEYNIIRKVYSARSPQEAQSALMDIRDRYGFTEHDSWVKGNDVFVSIERDNTNDSYLPDVDAAVSGYAPQRNMVAERKKTVTISESELRNIIGKVIREAIFS